MKPRKPKVQYDPYHLLVTLPDRMYPFVSYIDGERVRWQRSYEHSLDQIQKKLGEGRYGFKLGVYREVFHIVGAALLILGGTYASQALFGDDIALPALFLFAMTVITYQEFVLQPRTYNQKFGKAVVDWFSWATPIGVYVLFFLS